jgi:FAD:protein FMN transferase
MIAGPDGGLHGGDHRRLHGGLHPAAWAESALRPAPRDRMAGLEAAYVEPIVPFSFATTSMGGRLVIHLDVDGDRRDEARRATAAVVARIDRWAARLTRHSEASDLSHLNADPRSEVAIRPTLAAALRAGRLATEMTEGLADITLLDARLAAEGLVAGLDASGLDAERQVRASRAFDWSMAPGAHGSAIVRRPPGLRFDLGGVGKGWIADRALRLLADWPSVVVDADGDLAIRCAPGKAWEVAVEDPRTPDTSLAVLRLAATRGVPGQWGVATSGTSIHRWTVAGSVRHHLIDPRSGLPAATDVVQSTVIAGTALRAEALAKSAVISGAGAGLALLDRARIRGALVLTDRGEVFALPQTLALLDN